ncbi:hypothetical protein AQUSIP_12260 [Aquicella siphonis]|uniref:Uncharacterized protein n=1 Tax=Aquicella siphonis TaxID=254247 RepID=A0A5E4PH64_9COXI|nr:hypothetical protein [Aquicella siphonis]VVC75925.1 hypothetical protein AQUSIP_12260 [Aquicella siphonis]
MSSPRANSSPLDIPGSSDHRDNDLEITVTTDHDQTTYVASLSPGQRAEVDFGSLPADEHVQVAVRSGNISFRLGTTPENKGTSSFLGSSIPVPSTSILPLQPELRLVPSDGSQGHEVSLNVSDEIGMPHPADSSVSASTLRNRRKRERKRLAKQRKRAAAQRDIESALPTERDSLLRVSDEIINSEPLTDDEPTEEQQGWCAWACSGAASFTKTLGGGAYYVVTHPISVGLSVLTAAPPALNSLAMPSGESPEKIGPEWWAAMSTLVKTHSIVNSASSLGINAIMNAFFLPTAWDKFKNSITHTFDSPREFFDNVFSILFGVGGALAAAAIAYSAFLWLPAGAISASVPAVISFVVTLASRYIGVKNVFKRIHHLFNDDAKAQADFAEALEHIKEDYLEEIQSEFDKIIERLFAHRDADTPLTNADYEQIADELTDVLTRLADAHPDLIKDKTTLEYITKYTGMLFDITFALTLVGVPSYLTFMQKGFDGVNTLAKFAGNDLSGINIWLKRLIGVIPGLASAMLYADSGTKIRTTLTQLACHLYENPKQIPAALAVLGANGFAASGPQNVAAGVLANPDNIIGLTKDTALGSTFVILNAISGGGAVNANASLTKAFLSTNPDAVHVSEKDLAKHLGKVSDTLVSHRVADKFKVFMNKVNHEPDRDAVRAELDHTNSVFI